jgi:hypothetical protein
MWNASTKAAGTPNTTAPIQSNTTGHTPKNAAADAEPPAVAVEARPSVA